MLVNEEIDRNISEFDMRSVMPDAGIKGKDK